jgi:structural maintenance of chromosome 3 (chondroitin sulfate proteoglycan 6)
MTLRTQLEFKTKELSETIQSFESTLRQNKSTLSTLLKQIAKEQQTLNDKIEPKYEDAKDTLSRMNHERNEAKKKIDGLYAKQGRGKQFQSKSDRDQYLQSQIDDLDNIKREKESMMTDAQDALANLRRSITAVDKDLNAKNKDVLKMEKTLDVTQQKLVEKRRDRNEMAERRKVYWGNLSELTAQVSEARDNVRRAQSTFRKVMPRNTAMGLDALNRIIQEERVIVGQQYFGPVMQNIELVDAKFQTAVEAAANNALFHVIVDTDATAAKLMKRLERDRLGRVTFLPLNQLNVSDVNYPDSPDIVSLMNKCLKYDPRLKRAMQHVFGKKLLANSAEVASTWSTRCQMDAVTLDGDLCSRKGAMSGGFIDSSKR